MAITSERRARRLTAVPIHYDLHVWLYQTNRNGQLVSDNPEITCK